MLDISRVKFEERVMRPDLTIDVIYFTIDKDLLHELSLTTYPDAEHGTLALDFYGLNTTGLDITCMVSPTKDGSDYDWTIIELSNEDIEKLIELGEIYA
jgi:hypothetical protein